MKANQLNIQKFHFLLVSLIFALTVPTTAMGGSITGNVTDSQGGIPIIGLSINLFDHFSGEYLEFATTDDNGDFF